MSFSKAAKGDAASRVISPNLASTRIVKKNLLETDLQAKFVAAVSRAEEVTEVTASSTSSSSATAESTEADSGSNRDSRTRDDSSLEVTVKGGEEEDCPTRETTVDSSSSEEDPMLTDTTGHSPISARLRLRIQHDQTVQRRKLQKKLHPLSKSSLSLAKPSSPGRNRLLTTPRSEETEPTAAVSTEKKIMTKKQDVDPPVSELEPTSKVERKAGVALSAGNSKPVVPPKTALKSSLGKQSPPPNDKITTIAEGAPSTKAATAPASRSTAKKLPPGQTGKKTPSFPCWLKTTPAVPRRKSVVEPPPSPTLQKRRNSGQAYVVNNYLLPELASPEERQKTVTVVFDLDETLVNNRTVGRTVFRPHVFDVLKKLRGSNAHPVYSKSKTPAGNRLYEYSYQRCGFGPSCHRSVSEETEGTTLEDELRVEVVLWTASVELVAKPVMAKLDPDRNIFDQVVYRDFRWYKDVDYTKDLRMLGRDMDRVVIIENSPSSVTLNRTNAILVSDYVSGFRDRELIGVLKILRGWMEQVRTKMHLVAPSVSSVPSSVFASLDNTVVMRSRAASARSSRENSISEFKSKSPSKDPEIHVDPVPASSSNLATRSCSPAANAPPAEPQMDDIRVFLKHHPYVGSTTGYLVLPSSFKNHKAEDGTSPAPKSGEKKEPAWKRLYARAERDANGVLSGESGGGNGRKMLAQPPPPPSLREVLAAAHAGGAVVKEVTQKKKVRKLKSPRGDKSTTGHGRGASKDKQLSEDNNDPSPTTIPVSSPSVVPKPKK